MPGSNEIAGLGPIPGSLWIQQQDVPGPEGNEIALARMTLATGDAEAFYSNHPALVRREVVEVFGLSPEFVAAARARLAEIQASKADETASAGRHPSQYFDKLPS